MLHAYLQKILKLFACKPAEELHPELDLARLLGQAVADLIECVHASVIPACRKILKCYEMLILFKCVFCPRPFVLSQSKIFAGIEVSATNITYNFLNCSSISGQGPEIFRY